MLGKHRAAIGIYEEAKSYSDEDWEIAHNMGLCHLYLKQYERAEDCFVKANIIQRHDATYVQLGKLYTLQDKYHEAIDVYLESLDYSPENPELLTTVGLLYLRLSENYKAFDYLGMLRRLMLSPPPPMLSEQKKAHVSSSSVLYIVFVSVISVCPLLLFHPHRKLAHA